MIAIIRVARPLTCLLAGIFLFFQPAITNAEGVASLDPDFDVEMKLVGEIGKLTKQSDGKLIVAGNFSEINGKQVRLLARLNPDGSLDESFEFGFTDVSTILHLGIQSDDKIVFTHPLVTAGLPDRVVLSRALPDGQIDESFNEVEFYNSGTAPSVYDVRNMRVQSDDSIVVVGEFIFANNTNSPGIARLLSNGEIDPSFSSSLGDSMMTSFGHPSPVLECFTLPDGKLLISHIFESVIGNEARFVTRLNSDGSVDPEFKIPFFDTVSGIRGRYNLLINNIKLDSEGSIFLSGNFLFNSPELFSQSTFIGGLLKFSPDLSVDAEFVYNAEQRIFIEPNIQLLEDSRVLVSQQGTVTINGDIQDTVFLLTETGQVDDTFTAGIGSDLIGYGILPIENGDLIISGRLKSTENVETSIVRLNQNGSIDSEFNCLPIASSNISRIQQLQSGKIAVHGNFQTVNEEEKTWLTRLNADGSVDDTLNLDGDFSSSNMEMIEHPDGRIFISGFNIQRNGQPVTIPLVLLTDGQIDEGFTLEVPFEGFISISINSNGMIHVLGQPAGTSGDEFHRFLSNGETDQSFTPLSMSSRFFSWIELSDGSYLFAKRTTLAASINGFEINGLAKVLSDGTFDSEFDGKSVPNGSISAFAVQPDDRVIIYGDFGEYNGETVGRLIRIFPDGTLDHSFHYDGPESDLIDKILVSESGDIFLNSKPPVRIFNDGKVDPFFKIGTIAGSGFNDIALGNEEELIIAGSFSEIEGQPRDGLARLIIDDSKVFMTLPQVGDQSVDFQFNSEEGKSYSVEYQEAIGGEWSGLETGVSGNGSLRTVSDSDPVSAQRIYRVTTEQ